MTRLERLVRDLAPERTIYPVARRVDEAINTFPVKPPLITRYEDFVEYIVALCRHIEAAILCLPEGHSAMDKAFEPKRYLPVLTRAYGNEGIKAAFEIARTGKEGGVYAVIKRVGEVLGKECVDNIVVVSVWSYWNSLSVEDKYSAVDEYLARYAYLWPSELTEGCAGRMRANFPKFLQQHPRMIERLHQAVR